MAKRNKMNSLNNLGLHPTAFNLDHGAHMHTTSAILIPFSISLGHHVRGKKQLITFYHRGIGGSDGKKRSSRGVVWDLKTFASFKEELGDSEVSSLNRVEVDFNATVI